MPLHGIMLFLNMNEQSNSGMLHFKSLLNFRDLGGIAVAGNMKVKHGMIFRSANPDRLSAKDLYKLRQLNVRLIIDLRATHELRKRSVSPDRIEKLTLPLDFQFKTRERLKPVIYDKDAHSRIEEISNGLYLEILDATLSIIGPVMKSLASPDRTPVLIHCQVGKDRTGIVIAIILLALGADRELVIEDYLKSNDALLPFFKRLFLIRKIISFGFFPYGNMLFAVSVKRRNIESIIDRIENHYGGIEAFLRKAGVDDKTLAEIKHRMLRA